ncbi:hypothetical protein [Planococcus halotolerans]|uniref:Glycosyl hydrolase-like 10 domain-containing protein n=1 Tax=Planococcus halotolerans TaxID=2233542 RepID=A0A365L5N3_9BACL|nr:hypothetical protein [Planococcus halotolerans]RAZ80713.1 hypothetical protein DP120_00015 [Planococcus halotolerans]
MRGLLLYSEEAKNAKELSFIKELQNAGIDTVVLIIKDYNGSWMTLEEVKEIKLFLKKQDIKLFGWICTLTEGYEGELTKKNRSPFFEERKWSVIDMDGNNTIDKPIYCDLGYEQYACPNNNDHTDFVISTLLEYKECLEGVLFDFVRFPLEEEYCFCEECNKLSRKIYNKDIKKLSTFERFLFKKESITRFVNKLNSSTDLESTFLVWPEFYTKDLMRSQDYKNWKVDNISPMMYKTLWPSEKFLKNIALNKTIAKSLPLYILDESLKTKVKSLKTFNDDFIITHYKLKSPSNLNGFKIKRIFYMVYRHIEYYDRKLNWRWF